MVGRLWDVCANVCIARHSDGDHVRGVYRLEFSMLCTRGVYLCVCVFFFYLLTFKANSLPPVESTVDALALAIFSALREARAAVSFGFGCFLPLLGVQAL